MRIMSIDWVTNRGFLEYETLTNLGHLQPLLKFLLKIWVKALFDEPLEWTNSNLSINMSKSFSNGKRDLKVRNGLEIFY